jgi:hypothetical protein
MRALLMRLLLAFAMLLAGCAIFSPIPDMRTAKDHAREVEPRCKGFADDKAPVLSATVIDKVEPAYSYVKSGPNDPEARLRGARLHVRPLPGLTSEILARTLECHEVRVTLGATPALANDPYVLPDRWLDIDVDSEGDGFVAQVRIDAFDDAKEVLARARAFAAHPAP